MKQIRQQFNLNYDIINNCVKLADTNVGNFIKITNNLKF